MHPIDWKKNCTWQAEKTAGAFCAGCPVHFPFQSFIFSADFFSFCTVAVCTAATPSPKKIRYPDPAHSLRSALHIEGRHAGIYRSIAQLLLDAQKLVVFCHTLGSGRCTCFDLARIPVLLQDLRWWCLPSHRNGGKEIAV